MDNLPHWLTTEIAVIGQISTEDIKDIKEMGFKSIICNRPDFESETNQPSHNSIETTAKKLDLNFKFLPVASRNHSEAEALKMANYVSELPKPVLAYCKTGGRSSALIGLSVELGFLKPYQ